MTSHASITLTVVTAALVLGRVGSAQVEPPVLVRAPDIAVGPGSGQIVVADINHDGHLDVIARHLMQREISVFLGDGRGAFRPAPVSRIALPYRPGMIAVADMNGDNHPDVAIASSERNEIDVFAGNGTGAFARVAGSPFRASPSEDFFTRGIYLTDVNEDGQADLLTTNGRDSSFAVLLGKPGSWFVAGPIVQPPSNPLLERYAFALGDVNGDRHIDVVIAARRDDWAQPGRLKILLGDGTGAFRENPVSATIPSNPHSLTLADLNGDGRPDLVMSHSGSGTITVLLNSGGARFELAPGSPFDVGAEAFDVGIADINSDGKPDLLAATGGTIAVWAGDGRGRFQSAPGSPFRAGPGAYHFAVRDINEDGRSDVVVASFEGTAAAVYLSNVQVGATLSVPGNAHLSMSEGTGAARDRANSLPR
jgi:hypothetical protein